ncbi:MAG TPA: DoxX family protein [Agriterribacter sp.]|nr:DoxX family protein [Agriterribacter sp.]
MKKTKIAYWIITGIFTAFMLFSAVPDLLLSPDAVTMITGLGYPKYFVAFIGAAKVLGVIAVLVPGFNRLKEWAYAGLFFDLFGAAYSAIAMEGFHLPIAFFILPVGFLFLSYFLWHKLEREKIKTIR